MQLRCWCVDSRTYAINDDNCPNYDQPVTFLETPYIIGVMPGSQNVWFLWQQRWAIGVILTALFRQNHLRNIGQWRVHHNEFANQIVSHFQLSRLSQDLTVTMTLIATVTVSVTAVLLHLHPLMKLPLPTKSPL